MTQEQDSQQQECDQILHDSPSQVPGQSVPQQNQPQMQQSRQSNKQAQTNRPQTHNVPVLFTRAFAMAAVINLCIFMSWQITCVGVPVYVSELGGTDFEVGLVATITTITATVFRPFLGILADRYGRKVFEVWGLLFIIAAIIATIIFPVVGIVLALRVVHGIGWGIGATANSTVCADVVPKKRFGEGMGYLAMTNSLAMALGPVIAYAFIDQGCTTNMLYVSAGFAVLALIAAIIFFKTTYKQPQLIKEPLTKDFFRLSNLFEKAALVPSIVIMMNCIGFGTISVFIALHAAEVGVSNVSIYFIVYAIVSVLSRPLIGRMIDRLGFWQIGIISCVMFAASLALIGVADSVLLFGIAGACVGIGLGSAMSTFQTMAVAIVPPQRRGVATATYFFFFDIGIGVGSFVGGILASAFGYSIMYLIISLMPLVGCLIFVLQGKKRIDAYHESQMS